MLVLSRGDHPLSYIIAINFQQQRRAESTEGVYKRMLS